MPVPSSKKVRSSRIRGRLRSVCAYVKEERLELRRVGHSQEIQNTTTVVTANGEVQTREEAQVYVHDLHIFVTVHVQLLEDTPALLFLGKLSKEQGYTCEWSSGREPRLTKTGKQTFCKTENFVPLVVPGLSSSSTTTSSSTMPPQDLSISLDPANTRSEEGATRNCSEEYEGNCSEGIPECPEDFTENLEVAEKPAAADISHDSDSERPKKWHQRSSL